jgi:hypothetical protein
MFALAPSRAAWISALRLVALLLFAIACGACSSFSTSNRGISSGRVAGQLYYLPQGKIRLMGEWKYPGSPGRSVFIVTIVEEIEADPSARYYLKPDINVFYDDDTQLTVNAKGLLTMADASAEDKTQAIVATVASAGADALEFAAGGGLPGLTVQGAQEPAIRLKPFNLVFDPTDKTETEQIVARVAKCGFAVRVKEERVEGVPLGRSNRNANADVLTHGVVFRPVKPWRVILDGTDDSVAALRESKLIHLPDKTHPLVFDYTRVPFVKKVTNVTFVDGMMRDYSHKLPSPVLGFLGIPKAVLGAIAPLPLQLKQTQITTLRADETLRKLRASGASSP